MRLFALFVSIAILGAGCSSFASTTTTSVVIDEGTFSVPTGCGQAFSVRNEDRTVGLTLSVNVTPSTGIPRGMTESGRVPEEEWSGEVLIGADLFANWCDDVIEPGEAYGVVSERWEIVAGSLDVVSLPDGRRGEATALATGLVARTPEGRNIEIGRIELTNAAWGVFGGG